ncbi:MAG: type II and III secretion system protein [Crocinitomix sp.]|nr:type II and III secretion system protein [Crocinitomix sp.]
MMKFKIMILAFVISLCGFGQEPSLAEMERNILDMAKVQPGLNEKVQVSVSGIALSDFISAIAFEHNLNVSVSDNLNGLVVNNFYDAVVKDVFIFLIKEHDLIVDFSGTIIAFHKRGVAEEIQTPYQPRAIDVTYKTENEFLSLNLKRDTLSKVAEAITRESGKNVILAPSIKERTVSVYIENRPFEQVMDMMAKSNGLSLTTDANGFYYLDTQESKLTNGANNTSSGRNNSGRGTTSNEAQNLNLQLNPNNPEKLNIEATNTSISAIIESASAQLGEHYFMYDTPEGNTTLKVHNVSFMELLSHLLNGTDFTFKKMENYYIIGNRNTEGLRATELIRLDNRTIETVIDLIPSELVADIEIKEFVELNGMIVSGSYLKIEELKAFIRSVDQVVPMVQIDIIIVFSERSSGITKEMKAGLSQESVPTQGQVFPGVDMTLGSETINGLINAFNGFGIVNIGAVTPNFYASLKYLESNSVIDISSTPKISTLNGHEATFSVGETSYYQEERVNIQSSIGGPVQVSNKVWKQTAANLDITVKPFVSADEYVTLEINVTQNDFQGKVDPTAPPNQSTQSFVSLIRVKNGEMILMGGLEKENSENSGSGTPYLSRIPILKWFFSDRNQQKEKSKLHIFIKPTVTY